MTHGVVVIKGKHTGSSLFSNSRKAFANTPISILFWIMLLASVCSRKVMRGREYTKALWKGRGGEVRVKGGGKGRRGKKGWREARGRHTLCLNGRAPLQRSQLGGGRTHRGWAYKPYCDWASVCVCVSVQVFVCVNMYFNLSLFSCQVKGTHTY